MRIMFGRNRVPVEVFKKYEMHDFRIVVDGLIEPVNCRIRETDPEVFSQIFVHEEYNSPMLPEQAEVIVDAGANVGYSALFFARKYPAAKIIAIEPNPETYLQLVKNCSVYPNILPLCAALWKTTGTIKLQFTSNDGRKLGSWGVRTVESDRSEMQDVSSISIDQIFAKYSLRKIDIFKIDIEGAELPVFSELSLDVTQRIDLFALEIHEGLAKGANAAVRACFPVDEWECGKRGENHFFKKKLSK